MTTRRTTVVTTADRPEAVTDALLVALPETAGSTLYGLLDVFHAAGNVWPSIVGDTKECRLIRPWIVAPDKAPFTGANGVPVAPDFGIGDAIDAPVVVVPDLWIRPDDTFAGRYPDVMDWLRSRYRAGASIYAACTGTVVLAESGLLDGRDATSHWGYADLFQTRYPRVRFDPAPNLCFGDLTGRIVTAGGISSWHDLALHVIARHCGPAEALRIAKVFLMKWHDEGDLPFASLVRYPPHADAKVRTCQEWLKQHFRETGTVARAVALSGLPERTCKRRFKAATGTSLIDHVQNLRIEEAKRLLEGTVEPFEAIAAEVGYENTAFCRRLFKRRTGLTPERYRKLFRPIATADEAYREALPKAASRSPSLSTLQPATAPPSS